MQIVTHFRQDNMDTSYTAFIQAAPEPASAGKSINHLRRRTRYGSRLSLLCRLQYCLRTFPDPLQAEWTRLKQFKTAPVNRDKDRLVRKGKWREADETRPGAAQHTLEYLRSFYGYLALPAKATPAVEQSLRDLGFKIDAENETERFDWALQCMQGKGLDPATFSLALLTDADLVLDHMDFMRHRTGVYSSGATSGLAMVSALLRPGTGYLRQQPEFGLRLPTPIKDPAAWEAWCESNLRKLSQAGHDLVEDDQIVMSREPSEPIDEILALQCPVSALFDLAEKIKATVPSATTPRLRAMGFRDYLLLSLLPFYPLRIKHFSEMKLGENIYLTRDGAWRMYFSASAFKNERGAAKKDYDVPIDPSLWPILNEYVNVHRPILAGGHRSDGYVFLKARDKGCGDRIGQKTFRQIMHRLTGTHLGVIFGPHAVRHIIATTILKNRPNDWQTAADALHDTQATVRKRYAHLAVAEGVAEVNRLMSDLQASYKNP